VRQEKGGSGRSLVEEEELLILTNLSVVALSSLSEEVLVFFKGLLVGEGDTGDTLDGLVVAVT
jgi:hypothetical protein